MRNDHFFVVVMEKCETQQSVLSFKLFWHKKVKLTKGLYKMMFSCTIILFLNTRRHMIGVQAFSDVILLGRVT